MKKSRFLYLYFLLASTFLLSAGCKESTPTKQPSIHYNKLVPPNFVSVIDSVSKVTNIPVVLPDLDSLGHVAADYIHPLIVTLNKDEYDICFNGAIEFCAGVSNFGSVSGYMLQSDTLNQVKNILNYDPDWGPEITKVELAKGIVGWYMPFTCGANCNEAKVIWPMEGYLYKVGYEAAPKDFMIELANSAINNQQEGFFEHE